MVFVRIFFQMEIYVLYAVVHYLACKNVFIFSFSPAAHINHIFIRRYVQSKIIKLACLHAKKLHIARLLAFPTACLRFYQLRLCSFSFSSVLILMHV